MLLTEQILAGYEKLDIFCRFIRKLGIHRNKARNAVKRNIAAVTQPKVNFQLVGKIVMRTDRQLVLRIYLAGASHGGVSTFEQRVRGNIEIEIAIISLYAPFIDGPPVGRDFNAIG